MLVIDKNSSALLTLYVGSLDHDTHVHLCGEINLWMNAQEQNDTIVFEASSDNFS